MILVAYFLFCLAAIFSVRLGQWNSQSRGFVLSLTVAAVLVAVLLGVLGVYHFRKISGSEDAHAILGHPVSLGMLVGGISLTVGLVISPSSTLAQVARVCGWTLLAVVTLIPSWTLVFFAPLVGAIAAVVLRFERPARRPIENGASGMRSAPPI